MRLGGYFDLDASQQKIVELQQQMNQPDFWNNQDQAKRVQKELSDLQKELDTWNQLKTEIQDLSDVARLADQENNGNQELEQELTQQFEKVTKQFEKLQFFVLFDGEYDKNNAIVSFHAGSGGTEAQDWSEMLMRMIIRFCESMEWEIATLSLHRGSETGIKSATLLIKGRYAYGYLQSEHGVHRLVRISPFDAEKMRHTSFALIEILPELEDLQAVNIDDKDLRIDTFMSSGKGGQSVNTTYSAVRIVHQPTGITVSCQNERSQRQNKETAMKILAAKLHNLQLEQREEKKDSIKGGHTSAEWGSQIRSYVLHPYKMVKDHRSEYETKEPDKVLDGQIMPFIESFLAWKKQQPGKGD